jgi:hypothetical protein
MMDIISKIRLVMDEAFQDTCDEAFQDITFESPNTEKE